ncbi:AI-2E family transporter [Telmatocola sphagniphila]|uniref:AI-2E family transporter n=1 Tax=Telmatocola sphagniphila TaxID=1123043 RepID=A0A8E6B236_9BACT|nr:AI-2E family transporter [Telmatocola sphagniphila]QVL29969.1 AI-2E family transporter [Telmatocola sphagniphila]
MSYPLDEIGEPPAEKSDNLKTLWTIALWVVILSGLWYLLNALESVLKPFFLAVLLGYVILPVYGKLRKLTGRIPAMILMVVGSLVLLILLGTVFSASILDLKQEMSNLFGVLETKWKNLIHSLAEDSNTAKYLKHFFEEDGDGTLFLKSQINQLASVTASMISSGLIVGLYLTFMLLEAGRFPKRLERAFPGALQDQIAGTIRSINKAMSDYFGGKVLSSAVLAAPIWLVLMFFNVKLATFFALVNFLGNFIPYIGTGVGCGLPIIFALLTLEGSWQPWAVAGCLICIHLVCALFVEPMILGKAVGMSPLLLLLALAFWGTCWGFMGMLLAVPLTAMLLIILRNISATRSLGMLLSDE